MFAFDPPPTPSLAIHGRDERFPLRRIFCVGRNYAAHAREMGNDPDREPPFFFTKPGDAAFDAGAARRAAIPFPPETEDLHHEIELAVAIGPSIADASRALPADETLAHVFGYAVAIDLTRRDLQAQAKETRRPWDWAKAFDRSAPVAEISCEPFDPTSGRISLAVDGETRQDADLAEMIWPVSDILSSIQRSIRLAPGDLVLTGTPAGVGAIAPGETVTGAIEGLPDLSVRIG